MSVHHRWCGAFLAWCLPPVLMAMSGCSNASSSGAANLEPCKQTGDCAAGLLCAAEKCRTSCYADAGCQPQESCVNGACLVQNHGCTVHLDCRTPGPCEMAQGARCQGGTCRYAPFICAQVAPVNPCLSLQGECVAAPRNTTCNGQSCCTFSPVWPAASAAPAPACPFTTEDANGNGLQDEGESWTGTCSHDGTCLGCVRQDQCDDGNFCSIDACQDQQCIYDVTQKLNVQCTVSVAADGRCVADGAGLACRLAPGQACTGDADCADHHCTCADDGCGKRVCSQSGCSACQFTTNGVSACQTTSIGNHGEDCVGAGQACASGGQCTATLVNGQACTYNAECATGHCECADSTCSTQTCSPVQCLCGYNADNNGTCNGTLADGTRDPEDCAGSGCHAGLCARATGDYCGVDTDCASKHCVTGRCCDTSCTSPCTSCQLAGHLGQCTGDSSKNGVTCNSDGNACTADTCQSGVCQVGTPKTCTPPPGGCYTSACDPATGNCVNSPAPQGYPCGSDACQACNGAGTCSDITCPEGQVCCYVYQHSARGCTVPSSCQ